MALLTIVAANVAPVKVTEQFTGPAGEVILAGQLVRLDVTTGRIALGNGTNAAEARVLGVAITAAKQAGDTITFISKGWLDLGPALDALTFDDDVFASDTDGTMADSAGTVSKIVGRTVPGWGTTAGDRLLRVDL